MLPFSTEVACTSSSSSGLSCRLRMRKVVSSNIPTRSRFYETSRRSVRPTRASRRRLIDDRPEEPQLSNGFDEIVETYRLDHIRVCTRVVASHEVLLLT